MSDDAPEGRRERRRVLLLFACSILPPLILVTVLAGVAARNDEAALRYVQEERTRQAAARARQELQAAILAAEQEAIDELDELVLRRSSDPAELEELFEQIRARHPIVTRYLAVDLEGQLIHPASDLPFRDDAELGGPGAAEAPGASLEDYRRRGQLLVLYERALEHAERGEAKEACAALRTVAESPQATPTLAARARLRLGASLEALGELGAAREVLAEAADAPLPVRDERGRPVRVHAALRRLELVLEQVSAQAPEQASDPAPDGSVSGLPDASAGDGGGAGGDALRAEGAREARALLVALVGGARRDDLTRAEWRGALERLRAVLVGLGLTADAELAAVRERRVLERGAWLNDLTDLLPHLIDQAPDARGGEVHHHTRLASPPRVIAYRVLSTFAAEEEGQPVRARGVLVAAQLDLDRLARDVLGPACGNLRLEEEAAVAVLDGEGLVRAYAGGAARPGEDGRLSPAAGGQEGTRGATDGRLDLGIVPLWEVRVRQPAAHLAQAARNRLMIYGALISLTLVAAVSGAFATIRYVERSLELAKMKSDFVSNITHELKTPLTSIKMYGELLAMGRLKSEDKRREYAEHIVREGGRLEKLIEDVLDFARQDAGKSEYVLAEEDVADTVTEALDLFRHSAKVRGFDLYVELPPVGGLPPVDLDRDAIVRAVLNLLSNAVKYSTDDRYLKVAVVRDGEHVAISVEDHGIGIDEADLDKIFDRFYRAGDELTRGVSGAGLGLSLTDQIVRAHGGEIQVASQKGEGTVFTILLPIVEEYREQWPPPPLEEDGDSEADDD